MFPQLHHQLEEGLGYRRLTTGGSTTSAQHGGSKALPTLAASEVATMVNVNWIAGDPDEPHARRAAIVGELGAAAKLLDSNADAAALLLDGLIWRIAREWLVSQRGDALPSEDVLAAIEAQAPQLAWHLRLALRAPNPQARLVHLWACIEAMHSQRDQQPTGLAPARVIASDWCHEQ